MKEKDEGERAAEAKRRGLVEWRSRCISLVVSVISASRTVLGIGSHTSLLVHVLGA